MNPSNFLFIVKARIAKLASSPYSKNYMLQFFMVYVNVVFTNIFITNGCVLKRKSYKVNSSGVNLHF